MVRILSVLLLALFFPFSGKADDKSFDVFLKEYSSTIFPAERDLLLSEFWQTALRKGIPYIEDNKREVIFLFRGKDSVRLTGDFTSWAFRMPLRNLQESDLWYLKLSFEPDARLDYKFVLGNGREILDPNNPRIGPGGYGDHSELAMPDYSPAVELIEQKNIHKGNLVTMTVSSKILQYDHKIFVYLPPGYESSTLSYRVAYFQDGSDYINFGKARTVLDNLLDAKAIAPTIGVFVIPPTDSATNRTTEYGMSPSYEKFFITELIPFVDKKYRTEKTSGNRLIIGTSYGGLSSLCIAFNNQSQIENVASQSGYASFRNDTLSTLFRKAAPRHLKIYLGVGTYEKNVGGGVLPMREADLLAANRRLAKVFEQKQYTFQYREFHDGHSWSRWRTELPNILRWFFPPR
ncbi:MAG: alpha/beta hydrolase-fold protein [bacterium]